MTEINQLVDLVKSNPDLNDAMISDYPGLVKPFVDTPRDRKIYRFPNLDRDELLIFLENYASCEYEVTDSKTGKPSEINTLDGARLNR